MTIEKNVKDASNLMKEADRIKDMLQTNIEDEILSDEVRYHIVLDKRLQAIYKQNEAIIEYLQTV